MRAMAVALGVLGLACAATHSDVPLSGVRTMFVPDSPGAAGEHGVFLADLEGESSLAQRQRRTQGCQLSLAAALSQASSAS